MFLKLFFIISLNKNNFATKVMSDNDEKGRINDD